ncbi:MAG: hypothetical protein LBQ12_02045 [Deltaproteobacteria bacterium]|jgi:hypothetical protein|nr:hypothetical protein [Deltaproteobacteria bacterium]
MKPCFPAAAAAALAFCAAAAALIQPSRASAQPDPVTVYADGGQAAFFCSYHEEPESDAPRYAVVANGTGKQIIFTGFGSSDVNLSLSRLKPGTAITFDLNVTYEYDELSDSMSASSFMTAFAPAPGTEASPGLCATGGEGSVDYAGDNVLGIFCGYEPGGDGSPARATVQAGKGLHRVGLALDTAKTALLAEIPRETFFRYDLQVKNQLDPEGLELMPTVSLTDIRDVGEPSPGGCSRASLF